MWFFQSRKKREERRRRLRAQFDRRLAQDPRVIRKVEQCQAKYTQCPKVVLATKNYRNFLTNSTPAGRCRFFEGGEDGTYLREQIIEHGFEKVKRNIASDFTPSFIKFMCSPSVHDARWTPAERKLYREFL
jgi:hypothetical protein